MKTKFSGITLTRPGSYPFSDTNFQNFSRTQIDFSRALIHINPYTPKISMLILLIAFHTLHIFVSRTFQDHWLFSRTFPPGLFSPGKCHNKFQDFPGFPGLLRTLDICSLFLCHQIMHSMGFFNTTGSPRTCMFVL